MSYKYLWHNLKSIKEIINFYNTLIFDDEVWKNKWVWKVAEVTYSYDRDTNINETLFVWIWWLDIDVYKLSNLEKREKILLKSKKKVEKVLWEKINLIQEVLQVLQSEDFLSDKDEEIIEKEIFQSAVIEKMNLLEYALIALEFEIEKALGTLDYSEDEITKIDEQLKQIDMNLFGWLIRDNSQEVIISYEYIYNVFLAHKDKFTQEEKIRFFYYLEKIKHFLPTNYQFTKKQATPKISWNFLQYDLQRTDYILWFNMLIDAFGKMHHIVKSDKNAGSISDGPEGIYFPMNEKFNTITIERFFKLWMHEIETHSVTDHNSQKILWNLRGANSTKKDEWTAILMEQLFLYGRNLFTNTPDGKLIFDIKKFQINGYFVKTLMGEILESDELMDFLELSEIIDPDIIPPRERFKRLKRNHRSWVQHKDTTYTRWLIQAIEEVNEYIISDGQKWINPRDFFIWKVSFEETHKFKKLQSIFEQSGQTFDNLKPIFVSDAVYYVIDKKLQWLEDHINPDDFITHLKYKYPIFDFVDELDAKIYFRKNSRIMWIANVLLQIISNKKVENIFENADDKQKNILSKILQTQYQPLINEVHEDLAHHRKWLF